MSAGVEHKTCTKCGETKGLDAFHKRASSKDGRRRDCKDCVSQAGRQYYSANADDIRRKNNEYTRSNADHVREQQRAYRRSNPEPIKHYQQTYRQANPEYRSRYRLTNRDKFAAYKAKRRAVMAGAGHAPYSRADIFAAYGGTCAYCDAPAEHIDHVVPISKGGADAAHNLLPACAPCNLSKGAKSLAEWAETFGTSPTPFMAHNKGETQ